MPARRPRPPEKLLRRLRRPGALWLRMLRDKEVRIASGPPDAPYAVTVVTLSGEVIVQLERRFWLDTPSPLRGAAIRAHAEQVRGEFAALGSPAALLAAVVDLLRTGLTLVTVGQGAASLLWPVEPVGPAALLTALAWLTPRDRIASAIQRLLRVWLRRLLLRNAG